MMRLTTLNVVMMQKKEGAPNFFVRPRPKIEKSACKLVIGYLMSHQ